MRTLITVCLLSFLFSGCIGHINGTPVDRFKDATPKECALIAGGIVTSVGVHWLGHVAYVEANGIEWHQSGLNEVVEGNISNGKMSAFGRAGFVSQLAVGVLLNWQYPDSYFTLGYDTGTFIEIAGYPIMNNGDIDCINRSGNGWIEWGGYSAVAGYLLLD